MVGVKLFALVDILIPPLSTPPRLSYTLSIAPVTVPVAISAIAFATSAAFCMMPLRDFCAFTEFIFMLFAMLAAAFPMLDAISLATVAAYMLKSVAVCALSCVPNA